MAKLLGGTVVYGTLSATGNIYTSGNLYANAGVNLQLGTSYNILPSDSGSLITATGALTANITNTTYPTGFQVGFLQLGTNSITLSGVQTINSYLNRQPPRTAGQYASVTLLYTGSNWVAIGNLA